MFVECPLNKNKIVNMNLVQHVTDSGQTDLKKFYIDFYTNGDGEENYHWAYEEEAVRDKTLKLLKQAINTVTLHVEKPKTKAPVREGY